MKTHKDSPKLEDAKLPPSDTPDIPLEGVIVLMEIRLERAYQQGLKVGARFGVEHGRMPSPQELAEMVRRKV